eukprot:TRINITY_DN15562_c0_g1_i1.p1 TRINITY_DN15562_c0_g1~~TRINITY_DN15562_c0_g1_i1.p1  ORF type:complete len:541 (-),score=69.08 TRINITY_DN15562_c0_g1_i1:334-1956(-)
MEKAANGVDEVLTRAVLREELAAFSATIASPALAHSDTQLRALVARAVKEALAQSHPVDERLARLPTIHPWLKVKPLRHDDMQTGSKGAAAKKDGETFTMQYAQRRKSRMTPSRGETSDTEGQGSFAAFSSSPGGAGRGSYIPLDPHGGNLTRQSHLETIRKTMQKVALTDLFEQVCLLVLLFNAVLIGTETYYVRPDVAADSNIRGGLAALEVLLCWFFVVELTLRLCAYGLSMFHAEGWQLNVFDTLIVVLVTLGQAVQSCYGSPAVHSMKLLSVLRLLRLMRVARLLRVVNVSASFQRLLASISVCFASLWWVFILLSSLIYFFSVFFTLMALEFASPEYSDYHALMDRFGAIHLSSLTLFEAIFGGMSWDYDLQLLIHGVSPFAALVLLIYVGFCYTSLLNLITGVVVDKAMRSATEAEETHLCQNVASLFFDHGCDIEQQISWDIFKDKLSDPGMQDYLKAVDINPTEAEHLFALIDTDNSNSVDVAELINGLLRLKGTAGSLEVALLLREMAHLVDRVEHRICSLHKAPCAQKI